MLNVSAKQYTKQPARHHKSVSVIYEMESIRAGFFLQRKRRLQFRNKIIFTVKRRVPHVDFIPDLFPLS